MSTEKLHDVWASRDFPILRAATQAIDSGGRPRISELAEATGLGEEEVEHGLQALERRRLVAIQSTMSGPLWVNDVAGEAYLMTGLHPDGNDALEALAGIMRQAADRTSDPDEKGRLRRAASAIGDIVGQVGAGVMTAFITQQTGITP